MVLAQFWNPKPSDYHLSITLHAFLVEISKANLFPRDKLSGYCVPVRSEGGFCCFSHFCVSVLSSVSGQWRFIAVRTVSERLASGSAITGLKTPKHKCSHWRSPSPTTTVWCLLRYCVLIGRAVVDYAVWLLSSAHRRPRKWLTPHHTDVISPANYHFWWLGEETWYIFVASAASLSQPVHNKHIKS